jgi:hypothetical protein
MIHHLAQINIGRLIAPIDDPKIAEFVGQLEPVNALADKAPGFVWRLQSESGNATDIAYNDDPFVIVNMSVWESLEALRDFAYRSDHIKRFATALNGSRKWTSRITACGGFPLAMSPASRKAVNGWNIIKRTARPPAPSGSRSIFRSPPTKASAFSRLLRKNKTAGSALLSAVRI